MVHALSTEEAPIFGHRQVLPLGACGVSQKYWELNFLGVPWIHESWVLVDKYQLCLSPHLGWVNSQVFSTLVPKDSHRIEPQVSMAVSSLSTPFTSWLPSLAYLTFPHSASWIHLCNKPLGSNSVLGSSSQGSHGDIQSLGDSQRLKKIQESSLGAQGLPEVNWNLTMCQGKF